MIDSSEYIRLIAFLKRFDCNHREAATYIECLQLGMASVQEIAKKMNSNRVTVHSSVEQLIKKGLLFETRKGKKRFIVAESPDVLFRILHRKSNELKLIENDLENITKLLGSIQAHDEKSFNVRVYEGATAFKKIKEEMLESKTELCIFTLDEIIEDKVDLPYLKEFFKRLGARGVHTRVISSDQEFNAVFKSKQEELLMQLRNFNFSLDSSASFYLWENNVAFKSIRDKRLVCTIIQNHDLSSFFHQVIFENFWRAAHPITK